MALIPGYYPIRIHSNNSFCEQWHNWIHAKVMRCFKRNKDRVFDTVQTVRVRLLAKDFIGRWFFKHLTDEIVDRAQAQHILGGFPITCVNRSILAPISGEVGRVIHQKCGIDEDYSDSKIKLDTTLWRVSDLLRFAKFDYDRYYYSPQGHTIDSDRVLKLLGYESGQYTALQSMYRTKQLFPSDFTEHNCNDRRNCSECDRARKLLYNKRLSLYHNWGDPSVAKAASQLRWNDKQLLPFLRSWRGMNRVVTSPEYIMRTSPNLSVDAGLLKYAEMIINHETCNDFKRMRKNDDLESIILNDGISPELSNNMVATHGSCDSSDTDDHSKRTFRDPESTDSFSVSENIHDLSKLLSACILSTEESDILQQVELGTMSVRDYSNKTGFPVARIHRIRSTIIRKLRNAVQEIQDDNI